MLISYKIVNFRPQHLMLSYKQLCNHNFMIESISLLNTKRATVGNESLKYFTRSIFCQVIHSFSQLYFCILKKPKINVMAFTQKISISINLY